MTKAQRICQSKRPVCIMVYSSVLNSMADHNTMTITFVVEKPILKVPLININGIGFVFCSFL